MDSSGVVPYLEKLGYNIVGYGCMTCIGNSGPLPEPVSQAIEKGELVAAGVLSGNRNFEGRIHPHTRANYLASPLLVIAYALAGRVDIDFEKEMGVERFLTFLFSNVFFGRFFSSNVFSNVFVFKRFFT